MDKLDLNGLSHWTPHNAAATWEMVLSFHDMFVLEGHEVGCTSMVEHEIQITDSEPFKEWFRQIPPLLLEEVCASLCDMLDAGAICPSQSPWCNTVMLVWKKHGMHAVLLRRFLLAQRMNKERLISAAMDTRGIREYGGLGSFLHHGLQKRVLAGEDGTRVPAIHHLYSRKPGVLQFHSHALWTL